MKLNVMSLQATVLRDPDDMYIHTVLNNTYSMIALKLAY